MDEEQDANLLDEGQQEEQEQSTGAQSGNSSQQPNQNEDQEEEISLDPVEEILGEQEEKPPVSRRESKRIQQLLDKFAERDAAAFQGRNGGQPQQRQPRDSRQIIPEGEYDIEDVNRMAGQYGESEYSRGLSEAQAYNIANSFATRLEIDAPRVNSKHTFLDKESDDFNPGVAAFFNRMYLNTVGYDPYTGVVQDADLRYGEFVEGLMEMIDLVSLGKSADSTKHVAQQAAQMGLRPGSSRAPSYRGADPKKMTDAQLDAIIAAQTRG